ncbi:MAG: hypothetical protein N3A63_08585, partial [Bacteroidetes bacterium]|nr:hypothetical protein [Bacteroidota bacterium]
MIIVPKIFSNFIFVRAGMSTRWRNEGIIEYEMSMGYSGAISPETITHNREYFFQLFNINLSQLAQPQQQHTDTVIVVHKPCLLYTS